MFLSEHWFGLQIKDWPVTDILAANKSVIIFTVDYREMKGSSHPEAFFVSVYSIVFLRKVGDS